MSMRMQQYGIHSGRSVQFLLYYDTVDGLLLSGLPNNTLFSLSLCLFLTHTLWVSVSLSLVSFPHSTPSIPISPAVTLSSLHHPSRQRFFTMWLHLLWPLAPGQEFKVTYGSTLPSCPLMSRTMAHWRGRRKNRHRQGRRRWDRLGRIWVRDESPAQIQYNSTLLSRKREICVRRSNKKVYKIQSL